MSQDFKKVRLDDLGSEILLRNGFLSVMTKIVIKRKPIKTTAKKVNTIQSQKRKMRA